MLPDDFQYAVKILAHLSRIDASALAERWISWRMGMWRFCLLISFVISAISVQVRTGPLWFP